MLPSGLNDLYWRVSLEDIRFKLANRLALQNLTGLQTFQAMAEVVSLAFGGKKDGGGRNAPPAFDEAAVPKTKEEAMAMFKKVMGGR